MHPSLQGFIRLHSVDPQTNRRRWYTVIVTRTLWGDLALVCQWGRLGHDGGRVRVQIYPDRPTADAAAGAILQRRLQHGYRVVQIEPWKV